MYRTSWIVIFLGSVMPAGGSDHLTSDSSIRVRIVEGGESIAQAVECRRMLVGPGVNQPDLFSWVRRICWLEITIASTERYDAPWFSRRILARVSTEAFTGATEKNQNLVAAWNADRNRRTTWWSIHEYPLC